MSAANAFLLCALALVLVAGLAVSETLSNYNYCDSTGKDECEITNVQVIPCPEALTGEPCKVKRGTSATLSFDFTPHWASSGPLKTRAYWAHILDLPFVGMDTDACKYTSCPYVDGQKNSYNFTLELAKQYIAQRYDIKFRIWEEEAEPRKECCLLFKLKLL
ncbi:coagulation [Nesidiocoris tenuis]|uniref:Coagulation n=1 Tax=Nesidiocoris tenuis TaxID=355587 RepID=A0ABN7AMV2_9HEMI|nr:coagulation [Nesidiocoris tenuis]